MANFFFRVAYDADPAWTFRVVVDESKSWVNRAWDLNYLCLREGLTWTKNCTSWKRSGIHISKSINLINLLNPILYPSILDHSLSWRRCLINSIYSRRPLIMETLWRGLAQSRVCFELPRTISVSVISFSGCANVYSLGRCPPLLTVFVYWRIGKQSVSEM